MATSRLYFRLLILAVLPFCLLTDSSKKSIAQEQPLTQEKPIPVQATLGKDIPSDSILPSIDSGFLKSEDTLDAVGPTSEPPSDSAVSIKLPSQKKITSGPKGKAFANQFWYYLLSNNYKHWSPFPGKPAGFFQSTTSVLAKDESFLNNPHTASMKVYMNRTASVNPSNPPFGSILVMENYEPDRSLKSISVMYRSQGFNPKANDWYWVNYNPDGSVTSVTNPNFASDAAIDSDGNPATFTSNRTTASPARLMGRSSSCIACHRQSMNSNFAYLSEDERPVRSGMVSGGQ